MTSDKIRFIKNGMLLDNILNCFDALFVDKDLSFGVIGIMDK